jgi:hypothetical protein
MAVVRSTAVKVLTALAWLGTLALAMMDIYFVREIVFAIAARLRGDFYPIVLLGQSVTVIGGILFVVYMIVSGEYYYKHAGEQKAWTYLGRTYVVLLLIPILEYFM